jgi:hypothetical protein
MSKRWRCFILAGDLAPATTGKQEEEEEEGVEMARRA